MVKRKKATPVTLAQWGQPHLLYLPLYIALYGGFSTHEGLDLTLEFAGNDDAIYKHVATGKAHFGIGDPIFIESARNKKYNVTCPALIVQRAALWGVTHNPAIPVLTHIEDFVQLRIGSFPKPSTTYCVIAGLKEKHKRLLKYMQIVEAPIGKQSSLLSKNQADIILELEPMVSMAEMHGIRAVFSLADYQPNAAFTGLMVSSVTDPATSHAMVTALQDGLHACHTNKKLALTIAQQMFSDYPVQVLEKAYDRLKSSDVWPQTTTIDPTLWRNAVKLRKKSELL
jgi:NitT/TauT family transport system substrate-binding protein